MDRNLFGIVDPFSSGSLLAGQLNDLGRRCIMVQSTPEIPQAFRRSHHPENFSEIILHGGDTDATATRLSELGVSAVIAGCELGVELADRLSERLGSPSNGTALSAARRDKYVMAQAVAAGGLRIPKQFCSRHMDELLEWIRRHGSWPVIVKPVSSSASDGVCRCASDAEVEAAFEGIMRGPNVLGLENTAVLAQEFVEGTEYVVDTVSCAGRHRIAAFWRYGRPSAESTVGYDSMELLPYDGEIQARLFSFATGVLDALGVQYGPTHCELILQDGSITFVEAATRLSAGNNATLSRDCGVACQLDLTIDAYSNPEGFLKRMNQPQTLERRAANFFLMPRREGRLLALPRIDEIRSLRSFHGMSVGAAIGKPAPRVAGMVTLIHPDPNVIAEDIGAIRDLEINGLYEIDGAVCLQDSR